MIDLHAITFKRNPNGIRDGVTTIRATLPIEAEVGFSHGAGFIDTATTEEAQRFLRTAIAHQVYGELKEYIALVQAERSITGVHLDRCKRIVALEEHFANILKGY